MRTPGSSAGAAARGRASSWPARSVIYLVTTPTFSQVLAILLLFRRVVGSRPEFWQFGRAARQSGSFLEVFRKSSKFSEVQAVCRTLSASPLVGIFQSGYTELNSQLRAGNPEPVKPGATAVRPTLKSLDGVDRALLRATTVEMTKLEHRLTFLAKQPVSRRSSDCLERCGAS